MRNVAYGEVDLQKAKEDMGALYLCRSMVVDPHSSGIDSISL
jgi:hypothetical protein